MNEDINVEEQIFNDPRTLSGTYDKIWFRKCNFKGDVIFANIEVKTSIDFIECTFEGNSKLVFQSGKYDGPVYLGFLNLHRLVIEQGDFSDFKVGYWGMGTNINQVSINSATKIIGSLKFSNSKIDKLTLIGADNSANFRFNDLSINFFSIIGFRTNVPVLFENIFAKPIVGSRSQFNITSSSLGESEFLNVGFDSFDDTNFRQTNIGKCQFIACQMAREIKAGFGLNNGADPVYVVQQKIQTIKTYAEAIRKNPIEGDIDNGMELYNRLLELNKELADAERKEKINLVRYRKENYRQLKYAAQKLNDRIEEKRFHALEMNEFGKMDIGFPDKTILYFSCVASNFGQSFIRPIFFNLLVVHSILFAIYFWLPNKEGFYFSVYDSSFEAFQKGFYSYAYIFSPFRPVNKDYGLLDILFRINTGFFIYNFLRAVRKFNH